MYGLLVTYKFWFDQCTAIHYRAAQNEFCSQICKRLNLSQCRNVPHRAAYLEVRVEAADCPWHDVFVIFLTLQSNQTYSFMGFKPRMLWWHYMGVSRLSSYFSGLYTTRIYALKGKMLQKPLKHHLSNQQQSNQLYPPTPKWDLLVWHRVSCSNSMADCGLHSVKLWGRCHSTMSPFSIQRVQDGQWILSKLVNRHTISIYECK